MGVPLLFRQLALAHREKRFDYPVQHHRCQPPKRKAVSTFSTRGQHRQLTSMTLQPNWSTHSHLSLGRLSAKDAYYAPRGTHRALTVKRKKNQQPSSTSGPCNYRVTVTGSKTICDKKYSFIWHYHSSHYVFNFFLTKCINKTQVLGASRTSKVHWGINGADHRPIQNQRDIWTRNLWRIATQIPTSRCKRSNNFMETLPRNRFRGNGISNQRLSAVLYFFRRIPISNVVPSVIRIINLPLITMHVSTM
jgi:hypothetical protein